MARAGSGGHMARVRLVDAAKEHRRALADACPRLFIEVMRRLKELDEGRLEPRPLEDVVKTSGLTDRGTIVVDVEGDAEHRIVVRDVAGRSTTWT